MAKDAGNLAYYTQLKKVWETSRQLADRSTVDTGQAWVRFNDLLKKKGNRSPVKKRSAYWLSIAASIIILIGAGWLGYTLLFKKEAPETLFVSANEKVLLDTLADGSVVTLNKHSSISYVQGLKGNERKIDLRGEAFFKVTPDRNKPFVVSVADIRVRVVGTSFNIKNTEGLTEVVVETGVVTVTRNGETVELRPGEKLSIRQQDTVLAKEKSADRLYNYYRTKEFECDDTPLWKLVTVLNEAYDANIVFGKEELRELKLNATFINESLDQVLNIISLTFNIRVIKENDTIVLQ